MKYTLRTMLSEFLDLFGEILGFWVYVILVVGISLLILGTMAGVVYRVLKTLVVI